ncbi:MAG TPA: carboxypeptidase regulatory-like domain-containing protein, partial [Armatimonadota bacterium]|nr:carboxypeptidase regulatory-like domain-containing protein [Armatimonadota bacterium]
PAGDWSYGFDVQHVDARELEQMLDTPSWRHYCRWNWSRAVRSDAEGRFSIENVAPGVCRVAVMRESGPDLGPCEVVVVEGEAAAPIGFMIRLRPPGHITGRLLDADGQPLELDGAHYELRWERGSGSGRVEICETGRYYVRALQAGRARLTISAVGYERVTQDVDVDPAGQDADLDFVLVPVE